MHPRKEQMDAATLEDRWVSEHESGGMVFPDYNGYCVSSLPEEITRALEGKTAATALGELLASRSGTRIIEVMLDGFGYFEMKRCADRLPFFGGRLADGTLLPITTVFPSTTSAALTTLHTGRTPGRHGLIEWNLYLREIGMTIETLPFYPKAPDDMERFDRMKPSPGMLFDGRTVYSRLSKKGHKSAIMQPSGIAGSAYSRLISKGGDVIAYTDLDMASRSLGKLLEMDYSLIHFYYPGVDTAGHRYGPGSREYLDEMKMADEFLRRLSIYSERNGATLVVTSDHGQVRVRPEETVFLDTIGGFNGRLAIAGERVIRPYGSPRDVIVDAEGDAREFATWLSSELNGRADVFLTDDLIKRGLFGDDISEKARDRMSDIWVLPVGGNLVWYRQYAEERVEFRGMHGGACLEEMVVPLVVL